MADRALIIAIEHYGKVAGGFVAADLTGTLKSALEFRDWLVAKWDREKTWDPEKKPALEKGPSWPDGSTIYLCSDPPQPNHRGATRADIVDALIQLEKDGVNKTDNLYVYFSGHGFRLSKAREPLSDVLVSSDFIDVQRSADCCFKLDALIDGLRGSLGHGCHFYFIDACRNEVSKAIAGSLMPFESEGDEEPSWFVLQSTAAGSPALVGGPFAARLRDGLNGAGKAKVWVPPTVDSMQVRFDSLRRYVADAVRNVQPVTQKSGGEKGESDVVLATISPVLPSTITITLDGTPEAVNGRATITSFDGAQIGVHAITGRTTEIKLPPNYYGVEVTVDGHALQPTGKVKVEAYDDVAVPTFRAASPFESAVSEPEFESAFGAGRDPATAGVHVAVPDGAEVMFRHADTGAEMVFNMTTDTTMPVGTYMSMLRRRDGHVIRRDEIVVAPGLARADVSPAAWRGVAASESIAAAVPQQDGFLLLSETLGKPVADPDLNVWLSIIGAGRILGSRGQYSKISRIPLTADFSTEVAGASPIYVIAGFASDAVRLRVGVNAVGAPPVWHETDRPAILPGVRELVLHPSTGQYFVTFAIDDRPCYTLATAALPNRGTVIVLTLADDKGDDAASETGQVRISQYMVPIGHLRDQLDPQVLSNYESRNPLQDIYTLAQLTRAFRKRRNLETEFKSSELQELLWSKWLDPIGGALAAYELMRRRKAKQDMQEVAVNMERHFAALPDSTAIARAVSGDSRPPSGVPLFLDGLKVFPKRPEWLPYPATLLDFTGPWTAWRDAVARPD